MISYIINIVQETIKPSAVEIKRIIVRILSGDAIAISILQTGNNATFLNGKLLEKYDGNILSTEEVLVQ